MFNRIKYSKLLSNNSNHWQNKRKPGMDCVVDVKKAAFEDAFVIYSTLWAGIVEPYPLVTPEILVSMRNHASFRTKKPRRIQPHK